MHSRLPRHQRPISRSLIILFTVALISHGTLAQDLGQDDIDDFDHSALGPWSDVERTTLTVPQVQNASIVLDGIAWSAEYGNFEAVDVVPVETGWVLNFPAERTWDGPDDSSFSFWLAHDESFLYIGADVTDDVVNADDPNGSNWKDDSIELQFDAQNDKYDITANNNSPYGGHDGISWNGQQRAWDPELGEPTDFGSTHFATDVDWSYGEDGDVFAVGVETATGYSVEARYHKRLFEDPEFGNKLVEGYVMGFNITVDDDDARGVGPNGSGELALDEEISYYWAQRERLIGWDAFTAEDYSAEDIAAGLHEEDFTREFTPGGRLTHGAMGEIIFGGLANTVVGDFNGNGERDPGDLDLMVGSDDLRFDLNGDGTVSADDRLFWIENLSNTYVGDSNFDGEFNSSDFVAVFAAAKYETGLAATYAEGDSNGDGFFNSSDFVVAFGGGGYERGPRDGGLMVVPEPCSITQIASAFLCWCSLFRWRR